MIRVQGQRDLKDGYLLKELSNFLMVEFTGKKNNTTYTWGTVAEIADSH